MIIIRVPFDTSPVLGTGTQCNATELYIAVQYSLGIIYGNERKCIGREQTHVMGTTTSHCCSWCLIIIYQYQFCALTCFQTLVDGKFNIWTQHASIDIFDDYCPISIRSLDNMNSGQVGIYSPSCGCHLKLVYLFNFKMCTFL